MYNINVYLFIKNTTNTPDDDVKAKIIKSLYPKFHIGEIPSYILTFNDLNSIFIDSYCTEVQVDEALTELSTQMPGVIFEINGQGEESYDNWTTKYYNGKSVTKRADADLIEANEEAAENDGDLEFPYIKEEEVMNLF